MNSHPSSLITRQAILDTDVLTQEVFRRMRDDLVDQAFVRPPVASVAVVRGMQRSDFRAPVIKAMAQMCGSFVGALRMRLLALSRAEFELALAGRALSLGHLTVRASGPWLSGAGHRLVTDSADHIATGCQPELDDLWSQLAAASGHLGIWRCLHPLVFCAAWYGALGDQGTSESTTGKLYSALEPYFGSELKEKYAAYALLVRWCSDRRDRRFAGDIRSAPPLLCRLSGKAGVSRDGRAVSINRIGSTPS